MYTHYMQKDVTVIIVCYNQAAFLAGAIESVLHQTLNPTQIILIDNGSTDKTAEIMRHYVHLYYPVVISHTYQHNHGQKVAFNKGLELSHSRYTCFLDADDELDHRYLAQATHILDTKKQVGVVYSDIHLFGPREKIAWYSYPQSWRARQGSSYVIHVPSYSDDVKYELKKVNYIHNAAVFRTHEAVKWGGFTDHKKYDLRHYLWYRFFDKEFEGYRLEQPLFHYRHHSLFQASWQWKVRKIEMDDPIDKQILFLQEEIERLKASPFYKTEQILHRLAENFKCDCEK